MVKWRPSRGRYISRVVQAAKKVNPQEAEQTGKKLVDASKNVNRGKRARIGATPVEPQAERVFVSKPITIQKPQGFQPYYVGGLDPNPVLTAEQNQERLAQINRSITELGQYLKRMEDVYGIKTPDTHKAAMYRAVRTNPQATMAPPEGRYLTPYEKTMKRIYYPGEQYTAIQLDPGQSIPSALAGEYMNAPEILVSSEEDMATGLGFPYGPNSTWRKSYKPLRIASDKFDILGQTGGVGGPAPEISLQKLGEGLEGLASKYLGIQPLQAKQIQIRKPYIAPSTTVKNKYVAPNTLVTVNPEYLAYQTALKDMAESGIQYDARLEHPEWFIPSGHVIGANDSGINLGSASGHFSTQGFTTRGHMFGEDLDSGLGDLRIIMGEPVDPRWPKRSRTWYPIDSGSREDEIVRFIGVNPNKTGMWKQGGILSAKSGIHIKKANRGKFTDYCGGKVTSECIARGKASSNPTIRKRATFAANARKWKHQNGGLIYTGFYPNYKQSDLNYWDFNAYNIRFPIEPVSLYLPQSSDSFQTTVNRKSDNTQTSLKKQDTKITTTIEQPYTPAPLIPKGIVEYKSKDIDIGNMKELVELMKDEGISFRITSGNRPGALTSKGLPSHHGTGDALDITPIQGQTWDDLINQMKKSKKFIAYMKEHKLGILDERSPEMQARTGATGAHFHIGPDQKAVSNFNLMFG